MNDVIMDKALGLGLKDDTQLTGAVEDMVQDKPIGKKELDKAIENLKKYREGKINLENRIIENEQWWKLQHWEYMRTQQKDDGDRIQPTSAWLFNSLANKHADAMDNYPEPNVLPREKGDKGAADALSSVVPVVLERNDFEGTYSDAWWYKLKNGASMYGVFWNNSLENGLGDVDIKKVDTLNIYTEPGIKELQDSRNLFITSLKDKDLLEQEYPELKNKLGASVIDVKEYVHDDQIDTSDKAVVVDWYYKKARPAVNGISGGTILHYAKFVGDHLLFASENEPENYPNGWYEHGEYPIVPDVLFPEEGSIWGFGYIDIMKDPQTYIDKLYQLVLEHSGLASRPRYWAKKSCGINKEQFLDMSELIVEVEGDIDEEKLKPIEVPNLPPTTMNALQMKVDELKETSSNRDVSQGSTSGGVTAAAAIAALQEAGNKTSRDMINASYRCYKKINYLVIELIRQFYDEARAFRITGQYGKEDFVMFSNNQIKGVPMDPAFAGQQVTPGYELQMRKPIFDIVIKPQKRSAYSRLSQNELAKELYGLGLFDPANAEQALIVLDMMDFDGKDQLMQKIERGHTLYNMVLGLSMQLQQTQAQLAALTGQDPAMMNAQPIGNSGGGPAPQQTHDTTGGKQAAEGNTAMTHYGQELAKRATPKVGE